MSTRSRTRSLVFCALGIALMAVGAFITVPFGPVPFTLQTFMLILLALVLTPSELLVVAGGYLILGGLGLPIGAGFKGGIGWLFGPTGGFLMAYFVGSLIVSLPRIIANRRARNLFNDTVGPETLRSSLALDVLVALVITAVVYTLGVLWFTIVTNTGIEAALAACVLPFIIPDAIKLVAAIICAQPVRVALGRASWRSAAQRRKTF
jgi:biotin transport system substrate-specific component